MKNYSSTIVLLPGPYSPLEVGPGPIDRHGPIAFPKLAVEISIDLVVVVVDGRLGRVGLAAIRDPDAGAACLLDGGETTRADGGEERRTICGALSCS